MRLLLVVIVLGVSASICTGYEFSNNPYVVDVPKERSSKVLVWRDADAECYVPSAMGSLKCDTCTADNGFSGEGTDIFADPCTPSCDSQSGFITVTVSCTRLDSGPVTTTLTAYLLADCGIPSQPGVIIDHSGSTLKDSNASVTACDTDAGYVGTPDVSTIYCNSDGQWDLATGCTEACNGKFNCWPGDCGDDGKPSECLCSPGFQETSDITCELTDKPSFESCYTEANGPSGQKKSSSKTGTYECRTQSAIYGNFNPTNISYNLMVHFDAGASDFPSQPYYVTDYKFGVSDVWITVTKVDASGVSTDIDTIHLLTDDSDSNNVQPTFTSEEDITELGDPLQHNESLCLWFYVKGGGTLKTTAYPFPKVYEKTLLAEKRCFLYDATAPHHCTETPEYEPCNVEPDPLILESRISKTPNIDVQWQGWIDAYLNNSYSVHHSGIEFFTVIVNEVVNSNNVLKVDTNVIFTQTVNSSTTQLTLEIPTPLTPKLYCVTLEVKDFADNVGKARRFLLYDNTSYLSYSDDSSKFYFISGSADSDYKWQSHHNDTCVTWKDYFYNQFYLENNLLAEIEPDPHGFISGIYEQVDGELPVSGTPNVHGIVKFTFAYATNGGPFSAETEVSDIQSQTYCKTLDPMDGDNVTVRIGAVDILGNEYADNRTVFIDASAALLENVGLARGGVRMFTVHHETDLSTMDLQLDTFDPDSGIKLIEWEFGESDNRQVLDGGAMQAEHLDKFDCPGVAPCFCPIIGEDCEKQRYSIPLHGLVSKFKHLGDHNRNYFFTVTVTNNAGLATVEHLDILVDESSPQAGVILEGPIWGYGYYPDIDYISGDSFLVHWYGFLDHESEIKLYKLGLCDRCLSAEEIITGNTSASDAVFLNVSFPDNALEMNATFTGTRFVSVIALNNAMEPSDVVCSDGISRDISPPEIHNITLSHAKWSYSIYCHDNTTWLLRSDLVKVKLLDSEVRECGSNSRSRLLEAIPTQKDIDGYYPVSDMLERANKTLDDLYTLLKSHDSNEIIYLPNDRINLQWNVETDISQIEEFLVGFGRTREEEDAPGLVEYISTHAKRFFEIRHAAIGTDEEFFLFLKAVSKAGLETIIPIGPLLVDETPPNVKYIPSVTIEAGEIIVGWETDTFFDDQQTDPISMLTFQIGHDESAVTATVEWQKQFSESCTGFSGGCFKYPLVELQKHDTDLGLSFYVIMHVFNKAGHAVKVTTEEFTLPSMYPPAKTIIIDLDPDLIIDTNILDLSSDDIDAHLSPHNLCAIWGEFAHHDDIHLAFGAGTAIGQDDIYAFTKIGNTNKHCVTSVDIPEDVNIFISIHATSSGGSTISSSDGVIIYNETRILENFFILDGPKCITTDHLLGETVYGPDKVMPLKLSMYEGQGYTLRIVGQNVSGSDIDFHNFDMHIHQVVRNSRDHIDIIFQPYVDMNELLLPPLGNTDTNATSAYVYDCEDDISTKMGRASLDAHWSGLSGHFMYEAAAVKLTCDNTLDECVEFLSPYTHLFGNEVKLPGLSLEVFETYYVAVRPCLNSKCLTTKLSTGVAIELDHGYDRVEITASTIVLTDTDCSDLNIIWEALYANAFYKWTVMAKVGISETHSTLIAWRKKVNESSNVLNVRECISLPVHAFKEMYVCVRAYSTSGLIVETCKLLNQGSEQNAYKTTVYDFDANSVDWEEIKTVIQSAYIGEAISSIHGAEVDFATKDSTIVGAVLGGKDRKVKWFLMTSPEVPDRCKLPGCKAALITSDGYVQFPAIAIQHNRVYFICALASEVNIVKESYTEILPEIKTCSNGFFVDDTPPTGGELHVNDINGYLTNLQDLEIKWYGFGDNENVEALGYDNEISSYMVAIGSSKYGSDIKSYTQDGQRSFMKHLFYDLVIPSGTSMFVSVTAYDHAGLSKSVTSEQLVVDTTPPFIGQMSCTSLTASNWLGGIHLQVHLKDFYDDESGIDYYVAAIASSHHRADIVQETPYRNDLIEIYIKEAPVTDGHSYFLGIKAVNRAGLSSGYTYLDFSVDQSPPTGGHVIDGASPDGKDVDVQTDTSSISGHWNGFIDPHSGISYYKVGLGSNPFKYDLKPLMDVGLNKEIEWTSNFNPGETYYITVEACNGAGLCLTRASDGIMLDDSPPVPGQVFVGSDSSHQTYIPHQSFIGLYWTGFEDPQSGMSHYDACIGTTPDNCDIVPKFDCLLTTSHIQGSIDLPIGKELFAVVTGYNKNNQGVTKASKHFIVDASPPYVSVVPNFDTSITGLKNNTTGQWEKSVLKLFWLFADSESPITRHIITLKTHHEGHTPVEHMELGTETEITVNLDSANWLHNGDTYALIVTACNDAGLCTTAESNSTFVVDSTPPHLGGFLSQMSWENSVDDKGQIVSKINTTWYGFYDYESGVSKYYIGVGSTFTGNELTNGLIEIEGDFKKSEQNKLIHINEGLTSVDKIVVSVLAENGVGIISPIARVTLIATSSSPPGATEDASGSLEIENHSCDIHFCNKDCTCAVVGQACYQADTNMTCNVITKTENNAYDVNVRVYAGTIDNPKSITASSSCISAYWVVDDGESTIKRFEWTTGIKDEVYGEGIFDITTESPWMDVGKFQHSVHCLQVGQSLLHGTEYVVYLRVWVNVDAYLVYASAPLLVDNTPPAIRKGEFIKDSDEACLTDYDTIDWTDKITACWNSVFYDVHGDINHYLVSLGTKPGADDITSQRNVGLMTRFGATNLTLVAGQHYYVTVIAYNQAGLRTVISSDGFIVDLDGPIFGVVYNTNRNRNLAVQSATSTFDLTWHGFIDLESGVKGYYVALFEESEVETMIKDFTYVSIQTSVTLTNLTLVHGKRYYGVVKAINTGDLPSDNVISKSKLVDTTPPAPYICGDLFQIYKIDTYVSKFQNVFFPAEFEIDTLYIFSGNLDESHTNPTVKVQVGQSISTVLPVKRSHDGRLSFSYSFQSSVEGVHNVTFATESMVKLNFTVTLQKCSVSEELQADDGLVVTQLSSDTFKTSLRVMDRESGIKSALLGFGSSPSGFQFMSLYPVNIGSDQIISLKVPHGSKLYGTAIIENFAGLKSEFRSKELITDHTPPVLENVAAEEELGINMTTLDPDSRMMRLNVSWNTKDEESGIKMCFVSVGTAHYKDNLQRYELADAPRSSLTKWFEVFQGEYVYTNVKCVNTIGVSIVEVFGPIKVSLDKPSIDDARVKFIQRSQHETEELASLEPNAKLQMAIQSNTDRIQFGWEGFFDVSGISSFEFRLSTDNTSPTAEWVNAGLKDVVSVNDSFSNGEMYAVEICALSIANMRSDIISATILIDSRKPELTGQPLAVSANVSERVITLDWQPVFTLNKRIPTYFEVTTGSSAGYGDVFEEASLSAFTLSIPVSKTTILTKSFNELYIAVSAVYSTGERATYTTSYTLPF